MGSNHQAVFDALKGTIEVTATVDIDIEKANSAKEILNAEFATTDYREIWPYVDAVLIAAGDVGFEHSALAVGMDCITMTCGAGAPGAEVVAERTVSEFDDRIAGAFFFHPLGLVARS